MGNKVSPVGFRIGFSKGWNSCWFSKKEDYVKLFSEDYKIKEFIKKELSGVLLTNIFIERVLNNITIHIECTDPGIIIGKKGEKIKKINTNLEKIFGGTFIMNILESKSKSLNAKVIINSISEKINSRIPYKRAIKQNMETAMSARAEGIKVLISGRLGGAEIARKEKFCLGKISNHTLRSDIDYYCGTAETVYGTIGIKVWIYKGEIYQTKTPLLCIKGQSKTENNAFNKNNGFKSSLKDKKNY